MAFMTEIVVENHFEINLINIGIAFKQKITKKYWYPRSTIVKIKHFIDIVYQVTRIELIRPK